MGLPPSVHHLGLAIGALLSATPVVQGANWTNLTLYRVYPEEYASSLDNVNTADAAGDTFFNVNARILPLFCSNKSHPISQVAQM